MYLIISICDKRCAANEACVGDGQKRGLEHGVNSVKAGERNGWQNEGGETCKCRESNRTMAAGWRPGHARGQAGEAESMMDGRDLTVDLLTIDAKKSLARRRDDKVSA